MKEFEPNDYISLPDVIESHGKTSREPFYALRGLLFTESQRPANASGSELNRVWYKVIDYRNPLELLRVRMLLED